MFLQLAKIFQIKSCILQTALFQTRSALKQKEIIKAGHQKIKICNWDKETECKKKDEQENLQESNESTVNIEYVTDRAKLFMSFHMGGHSIQLRYIMNFSSLSQYFCLDKQ